jgi:hypothetical protein
MGRHFKAITHRIIHVLVLLQVAGAFSYIALAQDSTLIQRRNRFAPEIKAFLKQDSIQPPPKNAILFIGSSIFRQWKYLKEQMAPLPAFNRAFGGSRTMDILDAMNKIVFPYEPKIIVYYCGSNDVNGGENAVDIAGRFKQFSENVAKELPNTRVFYVSINRAPQKMAKWDVVDSTNALVMRYCLATKMRGYIDVNPVLFDKEGKPRLELYRDDKLHFKDPAYVEFTAVIKPVIEKAWYQK